MAAEQTDENIETYRNRKSVGKPKKMNDGKTHGFNRRCSLEPTHSEFVPQYTYPHDGLMTYPHELQLQ